MAPTQPYAPRSTCTVNSNDMYMSINDNSGPKLAWKAQVAANIRTACKNDKSRQIQPDCLGKPGKKIPNWTSLLV